MTDTTPINISYSDARLRVLVEEYITQQRGSFTLKGVCSYVLYWAMEEGQATQSGNSLFESNQLAQTDCNRVCGVLETIVQEGRIVADGEQYRKVMN